MTSVKQLEREAKSILYRRGLAEGLTYKEQLIKDYMTEHGLRTYRAGGYQFELTDGADGELELRVKQLPKVSKGQLKLFADEGLYE
jgi:hypothetical protein